MDAGFASLRALEASLRLRTEPCRRWLAPRLTTLGAACLALAYLLTYASLHAAPGNDPAHPLGWWGFFDQGNYLKSTTALAAGLYGSDWHWYPLGYAILGWPFASRSPGHPYLVPDLLCLLAAYRGFLSFAASASIPRPLAIAAFVFGTMASASLRQAWTQPWNTTLSAALIWWLLALAAPLAASFESRGRRPLRIVGVGAVCAAIVATRPTDLLLDAVVLGATLALMLRYRSIRPIDLPCLILGGAVVAIPYASLYLRIYGWHETPYMKLSAGIGFDTRNIWWKSYLLLVTPRPWLPFGAGLLQRLPWIAPGLVCLTVLPFLAPRAGRSRGPLLLLGAAIASTWCLFFAYADLQPSGLWLFGNIHYFKWTLPGLLLLAMIWWRGLFASATGRPVRRERNAMRAATIAFLLLGCVRLLPVRATTDQAVWMLQLRPEMRPDRSVGFMQAYFGSIIATGDDRRAVNTIDMRAFQDRQGLRLVMFSRPIRAVRSVRLPDGATVADPAAMTPWTISVRIGWPCWLPAYACDRHAPGS